MSKIFDSYLFQFISTYSLVISVVIGCVRLKKIPIADRPFIYLLIIGFINELISEAAIKLYRNTSVNNNIYVLIEAIICCQLFYNWGSFRKKRNYLVAVIVFPIAVWIYGNFLLHPITQTDSFFRIVSSFILVFLAVDQINKLIMQERTNLFRNSRFLICICLCVYFTYRAYLEVFFWQDIKMSPQFLSNIFVIMLIVNLLTNLVFALAVLWIPTKQKFILHS